MHQSETLHPVEAKAADRAVRMLGPELLNPAVDASCMVESTKLCALDEVGLAVRNVNTFPRVDQ